MLLPGVYDRSAFWETIRDLKNVTNPSDFDGLPKEFPKVATKKNRAVVGILFLVFLFFVMLMVFAIYTIDIVGKQSHQYRKDMSIGQVGVIEIEGVIMESKPVIELLHKAEKDDSVKAILVRINSPGGAVGPTQEIYEEIRRIDSAWKMEGDDVENDDPFTTPKPVFASFGSVAASGGYYVGSAARKIFASPGTLTGSIGVIMQFVDLSELFHLAKIEQNNIKSGRFKDIGSPARSMTEEESDLLGSVVNGVHNQFLSDILATREEHLKRDLKELAQGQIFSGADAFEYGLVDELAGLWEAGRSIHRKLKLEGEFDLKFIKERKRPSLFELLDTIDSTISIVRSKLQSSRVPALMFTP